MFFLRINYFVFSFKYKFYKYFNQLKNKIFALNTGKVKKNVRAF